MAHSQDTAEAGDAPVSDMDSAAAAIDRLMGGDDDPREEDQPVGDEPQDDEDQRADQDEDLDLDEDEEGESAEPAKPAIDAPASLTAEEKAKFAQLPEEAQRYVADLESRRAVQVQQATTKASEAQRIAEANAARADAQAKAVYAQQLEAFADQMAPQMPDPRLAQTDPAAYIALKAQYDVDAAQHQKMVQQIASMGQEAQTAISEAEVAERDRQLLTIPEVQNEETRNSFFERSIGIAKTLGIDVSGLNNATASEWKALRQAADWKEKADKYDAAMTRQMQRVRDGKKTKATKPNAAQPSSSEGRGFREAKQRARASGDVNDAAAALRAMGI